MFSWLFGKKQEEPEVTEITCGSGLTLSWNKDSFGWTSPLPEVGDEAEVYIGPHTGFEEPKNSSCALIQDALKNITSLNESAKDYLLNNCVEFVKSTYNHELSVESYRPLGIEIFEHEQTPNEYSLTYDPVFDAGALWRVRFRDHKPIEWGFDD